MTLFNLQRDAITDEYAYTCTTDLNAIAGAGEHDYMLIRNPNSTTVNARIISMRVGTNANNVTTVFRLYRKPVTTANGTGLKEESLKLAAGAERTSELKCYRDPSVTTRGTLIGIIVSPDGSPSLPSEIQYQLEANQKMLITVQNSVNNKESHVDIAWIESPV